LSRFAANCWQVLGGSAADAAEECPADGGITAAKGPVGLEAKKEASTQPEGELPLEHSMDRMKGKGPVTIK
jgi:hypothetical protein